MSLSAEYRRAIPLTRAWIDLFAGARRQRRARVDTEDHRLPNGRHHGSTVGAGDAGGGRRGSRRVLASRPPRRAAGFAGRVECRLRPRFPIGVGEIHRRVGEQDDDGVLVTTATHALTAGSGGYRTSSARLSGLPLGAATTSAITVTLAGALASPNCARTCARS